MCGICAVVGDAGPVDPALLEQMCATLVHRGPDSSGVHVCGPVGLGMRRLSIIDLSGGQQPIYNEDRSVAVVFNGEIYNYQELRRELVRKGHRFATDSDTEVIVHLYEEVGPRVVERLRGMFAFAVHDLRDGRVVIARDRLGIKPVHYAVIGGDFYVASEIKALLAIPGVPRGLDEVALDQYLSLLYIPAPRTIFRAIKKLPAGHLLIKSPGKPVALQEYWRLSMTPAGPRPEEAWIEEFRVRFDDAVRHHLVADVPVGVFLSGGLDSSGMVAAMARVGGGEVRTFSLGFAQADAGFDERQLARQVAERFGTRHEELEVEADIRETVGELAAVFDEPMGDSGAVPNFLICRLARARLTVALSGLGGDELAAGYERYLGVTLGEPYHRLPRWVRERVVAPALNALPEPRGGTFGVDRLKRFARYGGLSSIDRFHAFSSTLDRDERTALYTRSLRERVDLDSTRGLWRALDAEQPHVDLVNRMLWVDTNTYLVDDLLTVTDRTSMAVSLEARVPYLDHQLVEFMARVPGRFKLRRAQKKYLLRRAFARDVPPAILRGPKSGFSLPIARWLREDLRPLVEEVLAADRLRRRGLFRPEVVESLKRDHFTLRRNQSRALWALLMFELWADRYHPEM